jgi:AcrR family transcriptional regulator
MRSHVDHPPGASLRGGPNGLPRAQVLGIQRKRILSAAADVVGERGYSRATVSDVVARARVSRKTFYEVFTSWDDCFMCVFDSTLSRAQLLAREAYTHERTWREGIRAALIRLLLFVEEEPVEARILITEPFAVGGLVLQRHTEALRDLVRVLERGRTAATKSPPLLTAEALIGGVASIVHGRILDGSTDGLIDLGGELMSMIVLPYQGAAAAKRELSRPLPRISRKAGPGTRSGPEDPLAGLKMRLTYRTVQVLGSIGWHSGASNREIANAVGMADQGQISKLLARLEHLGLIENRGAGQANGGANAWHLTADGAHLERSTRVYGVSQPRT